MFACRAAAVERKTTQAVGMLGRDGPGHRTDRSRKRARSGGCRACRQAPALGRRRRSHPPRLLHAGVRAARRERSAGTARDIRRPKLDGRARRADRSAIPTQARGRSRARQLFGPGLSECALLEFSRHLLGKLSLPDSGEFRHHFPEQRSTAEVRLGRQRSEPALVPLSLQPDLLDVHTPSVLPARTKDNCLQGTARRPYLTAGPARPAQSIVNGPSADPLRNCRTKAFSEENMRSASPASTIRPFHRTAMYSPIWRAEAMLCVTTM